MNVRFGGLHALKGVTLDVEGGSITGLIGPNGAGKTTTFNVICGIQPPTDGTVSWEGRDISSMKTHERARLGIARTFQRLEVFGSLSARDNVLVAAEIRRRWAKDGSVPGEVTEQVLETVGISDVAGERVDSMPTGLARLVELARALAMQPRLMLLDEASSGLNEDESERMAELLLRLKAGGLAVLLVEHDVEWVMKLCDRIHVLDFGAIIASGTPAEIRSSEVVKAAYLGGSTDAA